MRLRHRKWANNVLVENKDIGKNLADLSDTSLLLQYNNLEIGSGLGGFLIELSALHPEKNYLGIEVNKNAFAMEVKKGKSVKDKQKNFLFLNSPIERIFPLFQKGQFENIYINFPDPWPRSKQHKRRLTYPARLEEYYRMLKDHGTLYFRSDNKDLFEDSIAYFMKSPFSDIQIISPFYSEKVDYLPKTEYESKFREKGATINLIIAKK